MKFLYAPEHTVEQYLATASEHVGHTLMADFYDGRGHHKVQNLLIQAYGEASNEVYLSNDHGSWWFPVSELWAYGTPHCLTCE